MADIPVVLETDLSGLPSFQAVSAEDSFLNLQSDVVLWIQNTGAEVTATVANSPKFAALWPDHPDLTLTIGASQVVVTRPFDSRRFNDTDGRVRITYSDGTNLSIAAIRHSAPIYRSS